MNKFLRGLLYLLFLFGSFSLLYTLVYKSSVKLYKEKIDNGFIKDLTFDAYVIDAFISRVEEGAKSLSSRTMIRKKIVEYLNGGISFQQLKDFTENKYLDGVNALDDCKYAARYIGSDLLVEFSGPECYNVDLFWSDTVTLNVQKKVLVKDSILIIGALSPIINKGKILGYDIIHSRNTKLLNEILKDSLSVKVKHKDGLPTNMIFNDNNNIFLAVSSGVTDYEFEFSIPQKTIYKDLHKHKRSQLILILVLSLLSTVSLWILQHNVRLFYLRKSELLQKLVDEKTAELSNFIEELRTANEALSIREEELGESNKTKDRFFSIVAHDLIGPVGSLKSVLGLLNNYLTEEKRNQIIQAVVEGVNNIHQLLENLLTWSRAQRGKLGFSPMDIQLSDIITEAIELLQQQAESKNIKIRNLNTQLLELKADPDMVSTIIRNLLSNAIKFTPKGGKVEIDYSINQEKHCAQVSVSDSGIGMGKAIQASLFKISESYTRPGTEKESGTGLGLVLCKEFVDMHHGQIWVESAEGKGTVFYFTIPMKNKG
jgi:signal transduction histidine kinase